MLPQNSLRIRLIQLKAGAASQAGRQKLRQHGPPKPELVLLLHKSFNVRGQSQAGESGGLSKGQPGDPAAFQTRNRE